MKNTVLVVDDDAKLVELISFYLEREGYLPIKAYDGEDAFQKFQNRSVDLVILDLLLPGLDGMSYCKRVRRRSNVPIIMLTAKTDQEDRIKGLNLGADDYVTKPFSPMELIARVNAVLRRFEKKSSPAEVTFGKLTVNFNRREALVDDERIELTTAEFEILKTLVKQPGRIFTRAQLLRIIQDDGSVASERTIDVHINKLRKKIETDPTSPKYIHTLYGSGYKFELQQNELD